MKIFLDTADDFHPFECDGPGFCVHCDHTVTPNHDPASCALCDVEEEMRIEREKCKTALLRESRTKPFRDSGSQKPSQKSFSAPKRRGDALGQPREKGGSTNSRPSCRFATVVEP